MVLFYVLKTRTGDYHCGIDAPAYDEISDRPEEPYLYFRRYRIPRDNIDYIRTTYSFYEFILIAKECGFYMNREFKLTYLDYLESKRVDRKKIKAVMYLLDL